jgi:hypothetical protein
MSSSRSIRAASVLVVCTIAVLVSARPSSARKRPDDSAAARAFAKASDLFMQRDFVGAIEAFEEAYRLRPHFMVQCNIARCHEWSGNYVQAAERYRRCLKEGGKGSETGDRAEKALEAVEARITWVRVESAAGGTVYVDGRRSGSAPGRVAINPGTRVIEVRRPNATPASATITTRGGEQRSVTLEAVEIAPRVIHDPASQPASQPVPVRSRRVVHRAWFWTTAALTVALAAAATGMGVATLQARDSYEEHPTKDGCDTALSYRIATNVLWGLTAAAGVTSTVLFFYTDFSGDKGRAGETLTLGLGVSGTF